MVDEGRVAVSISPSPTLTDLPNDLITDILRRVAASQASEDRYIVPSLDDLLDALYTHQSLLRTCKTFNKLMKYDEVLLPMLDEYTWEDSWADQYMLLDTRAYEEVQTRLSALQKVSPCNLFNLVVLAISKHIRINGTAPPQRCLINFPSWRDKSTPTVNELLLLLIRYALGKSLGKSTNKVLDYVRMNSEYIKDRIERLCKLATSDSVTLGRPAMSSGWVTTTKSVQTSLALRRILNGMPTGIKVHLGGGSQNATLDANTTANELALILQRFSGSGQIYITFDVPSGLVRGLHTALTANPREAGPSVAWEVFGYANKEQRQFTRTELDAVLSDTAVLEADPARLNAESRELLAKTKAKIAKGPPALGLKKWLKGIQNDFTELYDSVRSQTRDLMNLHARQGLTFKAKDLAPWIASRERFIEHTLASAKCVLLPQPRPQQRGGGGQRPRSTAVVRKRQCQSSS